MSDNFPAANWRLLSAQSSYAPRAPRIMEKRGIQIHQRWSSAVGLLALFFFVALFCFLLSPKTVTNSSDKPISLTSADSRGASAASFCSGDQQDCDKDRNSESSRESVSKDGVEFESRSQLEGKVEHFQSGSKVEVQPKGSVESERECSNNTRELKMGMGNACSAPERAHQEDDTSIQSVSESSRCRRSHPQKPQPLNRNSLSEELTAAEIHQSETAQQTDTSPASLSKDFHDLLLHQTTTTSQTKRFKQSDNSCSDSSSCSQGIVGGSPESESSESESSESENSESESSESENSESESSESESSESENSEPENSEPETSRDPENCSQEESSSKEDVRLKVAVQNCRSVFKLIKKNSPKYAPEKLRDLLKDQDVLILTETWLREHFDEVAQWLKENGYNIINSPRPGTRRGGGVAIAYRNNLSGSRVRYGTTSTFEYIVVDITVPGTRETIPVVGIYRLPQPNNNEHKTKFLKELHDLLCDVYDTSDVSTVGLSEESEANQTSEREREIGDRRVIIGGDFNLSVKDNKKARKALLKLLRKFNSAQHVSEPTHEAGNTLDLVFASLNMIISNVSVVNHGISDHYAVYFTAEVRLKKDRGTE